MRFLLVACLSCAVALAACGSGDHTGVPPQPPFAWQGILWAACSIAFIWLWFKVFKPGMHKTRAGMSKGQLIGEIGIVTRDIRPYDRGQIRLQKPVLGEELWESISETEIKAGERVRVLEVEGNFLKVIQA